MIELTKEERLEVLRQQFVAFEASVQRKMREVEHERMQLLILAEEYKKIEASGG